MGGAWPYIASSGAALGAGLLAFAMLVILKKHLNAQRLPDARKIGSVFVFTATAYTLVVLVIGDLVFRVPLPWLAESFGGSRVAWLLVAAAIDSAVKVSHEFI
jgi:hypothetical protein